MAEQSDPVVIVGAARTPMGSMLGDFKDVAATHLGGAAIKAALDRAKVSPDDVGEVIMGCCLMAGLKQAPARQAAHYAGVPWQRRCHDADQDVRLGDEGDDVRP